VLYINVPVITDIHVYIVSALFHCRGLLGRSIITAQSASPTFTHVYAALVAIVNTKFPQIGELIIKRVIVNFKKGFRRNDKVSTIWMIYVLPSQSSRSCVVVQPTSWLICAINKW